MSEFCNSAKAWLDADEKNVVSLHCKAGKGRAGIMTCCLLVRLGFKPNALEAMTYYDRWVVGGERGGAGGGSLGGGNSVRPFLTPPFERSKRVTNKRGLTVTSQRKWVMLYERLWREVWELPATSDIGKFPPEEYPGERYPLPVPLEKNLTR